MNELLCEYKFVSGSHLQMVRGDLTDEKVDAIVNAANAYLQHGGGVAGAIARKGGSQIQDESNRWVQLHGPVSHSTPAYTSGGSLPCRYVVHAVGPVWGEGDEDSKLDQAVTGSLYLAEKLGLSSLAFPAISTGIFGFPKWRAAHVMLRAIGKYFREFRQSGVKLVRLTLFDEETIAAYRPEWQSQGFTDES